MKKEWFSYVLYKFFYMIIMIPILFILNFADAKLIDLFLFLLNGTQLSELTKLIITLVAVIFISIIAIVFLLKLGKKQIRDRIFPKVPAKPALGTSNAVTAFQTSSDRFCTCNTGVSKDMVGMVKTPLLNGETAIISANIIHTENGAGMMRMNCQIGEQLQTFAFRINYCPSCGGKYIITEPDQKTIDRTMYADS